MASCLTIVFLLLLNCCVLILTVSKKTTNVYRQSNSLLATESADYIIITSAYPKSYVNCYLLIVVRRHLILILFFNL